MDVLTESPLMRPPTTETPKQLRDRLKTTLGALEDAIARGDRLESVMSRCADKLEEPEMNQEPKAVACVLREALR